MRVLFIILLLILAPLTFFSSCKNYEYEKFKISTEKEFTLSEEVQLNLPRMYTTVLDNPNNSELAFSNFTSPLGIVITDHKGNFISKQGIEGRGPGELQSTRYFGFDDNNNIVVLDKVSALFIHFNRTTNEIEQYPYPIKDGVSITSRNLDFCNDYWYLGTQFLGKPTLPSTPTVSVFDSSFTLVDSLGGYDPFFDGRTGIMQETEVSVDCKNGLVFSLQSKVPFIQVYSIKTKKIVGRTNKIPPSFKLSDKFHEFVSNPREWINFMSEEQSLSLRLAYSEKYIFHIFRNENKNYSQPKNYNDSDYFIAVYDKKSFQYLGELKMPGIILGFTTEGELITLTDETNYKLAFLKIDTTGTL